MPDDQMNLNPVTSNGETPLCLAIMHTQRAAIDFMVQYNNHNYNEKQNKFDLNFRRLRGGFTPLHIAVVINSIESCAILLRKPIQQTNEPPPLDLFKRDFEMRTARQYAIQNVAVSKWLRSAETRQIQNHFNKVSDGQHIGSVSNKLITHNNINSYYSGRRARHNRFGS